MAVEGTFVAATMLQADTSSTVYNETCNSSFWLASSVRLLYQMCKQYMQHNEMHATMRLHVPAAVFDVYVSIYLHTSFGSPPSSLLSGFGPLEALSVSPYVNCCVSGRNIRRFVQFRLGCHKSPILVLVAVLGSAGSAHFAVLGPWVMRGKIENASLAAVRAEYADLFTATTNTLGSCFAHSNHLTGSHSVIDCLHW